MRDADWRGGGAGDFGDDGQLFSGEAGGFGESDGGVAGGVRRQITDYRLQFPKFGFMLPIHSAKTSGMDGTVH
jgi:hypothetical protein